METKRDRMYFKIAVHGHKLNAIFHLSGDPIELCKRMRRIENTAHQYAEDYCNGVGNERWENISKAVLERVDKVLNFKRQNIPVFLNGDARGYALKIDSDYVREHDLNIHTDWGGYGIIAPDFKEE